MAAQKFVPDDFVVPLKLETKHFRLRMLSVSDVEKDYEAVMESADLLHAMGGTWPRDGFTIEENLRDLEYHQKEFLARTSFAYTVVSLDESRVLGCLYIDPTENDDVDAAVGADVKMWVRQSEYGLDPILFETVSRWISTTWPFAQVTYIAREDA